MATRRRLDIPPEVQPLLAPLARALRRKHQLVREYELIQLCKSFLPYLDNLEPNLRLFRAHFLVRAGLYTLAERWRGRAWGLNIDPLGAERISLRAGEGRTIGAPSAALSEFYLDMEHYHAATSASVAELLLGFWRRFEGAQGRAEALAALGVDESASQEDIRRAYRRAAQRAHPDMGGSQAQFLRVVMAYENLKR